MCAKLRARRNLATKMINEIEGLSVSLPEGAFYMFPKIHPSIGLDDKKFVLEVLENCHVLLVHGSGFGEEFGKNHFRLVYLAPEEVLGDAISKIGGFIEERSS
jgi:aspartate/methionine/tyrosine aminotransferase